MALKSLCVLVAILILGGIVAVQQLLLENVSIEPDTGVADQIVEHKIREVTQISVETNSNLERMIDTEGKKEGLVTVIPEPLGKKLIESCQIHRVNFQRIGNERTIGLYAHPTDPIYRISEVFVVREFDDFYDGIMRSVKAVEEQCGPITVDYYTQVDL